MKSSTITIISVLTIATGGVIWWSLTKFPKIEKTNINKANKTATIKIGSKKVEYKLDKTMGVGIPNVSMLYDASIVPNKGTQDMAIIEIRRNGKLKHTDNIYW